MVVGIKNQKHYHHADATNLGPQRMQKGGQSAKEHLTSALLNSSEGMAITSFLHIQCLFVS
jgi:hypothetical protein